MLERASHMKVQEKRALKEGMHAKKPEHLYLRQQVGEGWESRCEDRARGLLQEAGAVDRSAHPVVSL